VCSSDLLVVDDGSADRTPEILARLAAAEPRLRVVSRPHAGLAPTLEVLKQEATRCDYAFLTASDGEWSSMTVLDMLPAVRRGADVVVGRRKQRAGYTPYRHVVSHAYNGLSRLLHDVPRESRSVYADAEFLIRCQYLGYQVEVVDVEHRPRTAGKGKGARPELVARAVVDMLRLWRKRGALAKEGVAKR
jgi:glycosyltransferase involved in cell wall biosynthesis